MNNPYLKKTIIEKMYALLLTDEFKGNKLVISTANGIITGVPEQYLSEYNKTKSPEILAEAILYRVIERVTDEYREQYGLQDSCPQNDGFIFLKDVTIASGNSITDLTNLIVFYDQIIGITLAKI